MLSALLEGVCKDLSLVENEHYRNALIQGCDFLRELYHYVSFNDGRDQTSNLWGWIKDLNSIELLILHCDDDGFVYNPKCLSLNNVKNNTNWQEIYLDVKHLERIILFELQYNYRKHANNPDIRVHFVRNYQRYSRKQDDWFNEDMKNPYYASLMKEIRGYHPEDE